MKNKFKRIFSFIISGVLLFTLMLPVNIECILQAQNLKEIFYIDKNISNEYIKVNISTDSVDVKIFDEFFSKYAAVDFTHISQTKYTLEIENPDNEKTQNFAVHSHEYILTFYNGISEKNGKSFIINFSSDTVSNSFTGVFTINHNYSDGSYIAQNFNLQIKKTSMNFEPMNTYYPYVLTDIGSYPVTRVNFFEYNVENKKIICDLDSSFCGTYGFKQSAIKPNDIEGHWCYNEILDMLLRGILDGYDDGTFAPEKNISRGEAAYMLIRAFNIYSKDADVAFEDVDEKAYYNNYINIAYINNIVNGVGDNKFEPESFITRQDYIKIISGTMLKMYPEVMNNKDGFEYEIFSDYSDISDYARDSVSYLVKNNLITGSRDMWTDRYYLNPEDNITRAEAVKILYNFFESVKSLEGGKLPEKNVSDNYIISDSDIKKIDEFKEKGYYFNQLDNLAKITYITLYNSLLNGETNFFGYIDFPYEINNPRRAADILEALIYDNPGFFNFSNYKIIRQGENGAYTKIKLCSPLSKQRFTEIKNEYEKLLNQAVSGISGTSYEKTLGVYNYIIKNISYSENQNSDNSAIDKNSAYIVLKTKKADPDGYAALMKAMLDKLGVESIIVPGRYSDFKNDIDHTWLKVKIDNVYYNVDVFAGDVFGDGKNKPTYQYFLIPDIIINRTHFKYQWINVPDSNNNYNHYNLKQSYFKSEKEFYSNLKNIFINASNSDKSYIELRLDFLDDVSDLNFEKIHSIKNEANKNIKNKINLTKYYYDKNTKVILLNIK